MHFTGRDLPVSRIYALAIKDRLDNSNNMRYARERPYCLSPMLCCVFQI